MMFFCLVNLLLLGIIPLFLGNGAVSYATKQ